MFLSHGVHRHHTIDTARLRSFFWFRSYSWVQSVLSNGLGFRLSLYQKGSSLLRVEPESNTPYRAGLWIPEKVDRKIIHSSADNRNRSHGFNTFRSFSRKIMLWRYQPRSSFARWSVLTHANALEIVLYGSSSSKASHSLTSRLLRRQAVCHHLTSAPYLPTCFERPSCTPLPAFGKQPHVLPVRPSSLALCFRSQSDSQLQEYITIHTQTVSYRAASFLSFLLRGHDPFSTSIRSVRISFCLQATSSSLSWVLEMDSHP